MLCKQMYNNLLIPSFVSFSSCLSENRRKKVVKNERKNHGTVDKPLSIEKTDSLNPSRLSLYVLVGLTASDEILKE